MKDASNANQKDILTTIYFLNIQPFHNQYQSIDTITVYVYYFFVHV